MSNQKLPVGQQNLPKKEEEAHQGAQCPPSSHPSPNIHNLPESSKCVKQRQTDQSESCIDINSSLYTHRPRLHDRFLQCQRCQRLQERLIQIKNQQQMNKENYKLVENQYSKKNNQLQLDKRQFKENFEKNTFLLVSFLPKKYCQQLIKDIQRQIGNLLSESAHRPNFSLYLQNKIRDFQVQAIRIQEYNRRSTDQKSWSESSEKLAQQENQIKQLKNDNLLLKQTIQRANTKLKQKYQQMQLISSLQTQTKQKIQALKYHNYHLKVNVKKLWSLLAQNKQNYEQIITNLKNSFAKGQTGDSVTSTPVMVEFNGDLNIGNGHLRMKYSIKTLMVKEVLGKYFEPYEKKDIYGKDYQEDEMTIELNGFQIHKICLQ